MPAWLAPEYVGPLEYISVQYLAAISQPSSCSCNTYELHSMLGVAQECS
jgi:hypothetical protein